MSLPVRVESREIWLRRREVFPAQSRPEMMTLVLETPENTVRATEVGFLEMPRI